MESLFSKYELEDQSKLINDVMVYLDKKDLPFNDKEADNLYTRLKKFKGSIERLYNRNTVYHTLFVDVIAFFELLKEDASHITGRLNSVEIEYDDETDEYSLVAEYYEQAMNPVGFVIGGHSWKVRWKFWKKEDLNITGLPKIFSGYVLQPTNFEEFDIETPEAETIDEDIHEKDCEYKQELLEEFKDDYDNKEYHEKLLDYSECDCAEHVELYSPPHEIDPDYFWNETNHHIEHMINCIKDYERYEFPDANFDKETRTWSIGKTEMALEGPKFELYDINY